MTEYERVREQALLTDEEILVVIENAPKPCPMEFKDEPKIKAVAQAQLDKALKTDGIEIKSDDQSLPTIYKPNVYTETMRMTERAMLKAGFIKVAPKEE